MTLAPRLLTAKEAEDLMTPREAAAYLRVHRDTIRRLRLPFVYVGARKRYRRADLDRHIKRSPRAFRQEQRAS